MSNDFEFFEEILHAAGQEGPADNQRRYLRILKNLERHMSIADGDRRSEIAFAIILAHSLALRFFLRYGRAIVPGAYPEHDEAGGGEGLPKLTYDFEESSGFRLANPEDDLFEFLAGRYPDYRDEWLYFLKDEWISHAAYPPSE
ncbi:hypothetical protein [Rhizobium johnstonii]|uniref:hypothetical protein n=1 Tax=Rhizobium johnstonii TaxID=3019933 RepID=UPI002DDCD80C|nr:hypothetical protein U8P72_11990 [Rhizobium johnstonii]